MNSRPLSTRTCFLLILFFGIAAYSNTFTGVFHFDDILCIPENRSLYPLNLGRLWNYCPPRFITNFSFAFNIYLAGFATWSFHVLNLLIHILASFVAFKLTRSILGTPAAKDLVPPSRQSLFALVVALLFVTHPVQTEGVTYIVQRTTSLAALLYLATLWMYLKARLENAHHYRAVFLLMLAAMLTKEISITLPFAILLSELLFFPPSEKDPLSKKLLRWIPFAVFLLIIPELYLTSPPLLMRRGESIKIHSTMIHGISRWNYLLTQFRVERTYLRLLFFPVDQRLIYDYRLSSGWGDLDSWAAFSLLFSVLIMALGFFKKNRLLTFGVLWLFLTLSVESSLIPLPDLIFEHRLYLPMFGFAIFLTSLLWMVSRSSKLFAAISLSLIVIFSSMAYTRNEVWKSTLSLFRDSVKKSPRLGICYGGLADAYHDELGDDRTAAIYYEKALKLGFVTPSVYRNLSQTYSRLGDQEKSLHFQKLIASVSNRERNLLFLDSPALALAEKGPSLEVVEMLKKSIERSPENPLLHIQLGEVYLKMHRENEAVLSFRQAIEADPLYTGGYNALALFYKQKGNEQKAIDILKEYLRCKRIHKPLFGN